jgi:hypothetical protein
MNNYTHNIIKVNNMLEVIAYTETIDSKYEEVVPVNMDNIPTLDASSILTQRIARVGINKVIFVNLWNRAATSVYIKQNWKDIDEIIFSRKRTEEDKEYLSKMLPIQWALAQESNSYNSTDWQYLYQMIQEVQSTIDFTSSFDSPVEPENNSFFSHLINSIITFFSKKFKK